MKGFGQTVAMIITIVISISLCVFILWIYQQEFNNVISDVPEEVQDSINQIFLIGFISLGILTLSVPLIAISKVMGFFKKKKEENDNIKSE